MKDFRPGDLVSVNPPGCAGSGSYPQTVGVFVRSKTSYSDFECSDYDLIDTAEILTDDLIVEVSFLRLSQF